VYATAEPQEALELGGSCVVLHEGRVLQHGPVSQIYAAPASEQVARIITDPELNLFDVVVSDDRVQATREPGLAFARQGVLAHLPLGPARIGLRAHDLSREPRSALSVPLRAEVSLQERNGSETLLRARSGALEWTALWQGTHRAAPGASLDLYIEPSCLLAFDPAGRALQQVG
jgi:glycerol transport system ATP-binding protein